MRITQVKIYQPDGSFQEGELNVENGKIVEHAQGEQEELKGYDLFALPGPINFRYVADASANLSHAEHYGVDTVAKQQLDEGVFAFVAATRLPKAHAKKVADTLLAWKREHAERHHECADLLGLTLDKPLQHIEYAKPSDASWKDLALDDAREFTSLEKSTKDFFTSITVNPNRAGVEDYIRAVKAEATVVLADVDPDFAMAEKAIKAGARVVTRSWKRSFEENTPAKSVVDALSQNPHVVLELVASEKTASKQDVQAIFARYQGRIVLSAWDNNVFDAARRAIEMGVPAPLVIDSVTKVPAEVLGVEKDYGSLEVGKRANIILVDSKYHIKHIIHNGVLVR